MLVTAVLRPEQREDGQLEVVRLTLEQLLDARVLPVGEAELAVEWLFRDRAQNAILAAPPDGLAPGSSCPGDRTSHGAGPAAITVKKP